LSIQSNPQVSTSGDVTCSDYKEVCENVPEKQGAQGTTYIGCPDSKKVVKNHPIAKLVNLHKKPEDLNIYSNLCKNIEGLNKLIKNGFSNLVNTVKCEYCFNPNSIGTSNVVVVQDKVDGETLKDFILKADIDQITNHIYSIVAQVLGSIDRLYKNRYYHNDVHADNILLVKDAQPMQVYYVSDSIKLVLVNSTYLVKIIDYGLVTYGYPRDVNYEEMSHELGACPLIDIAQFLNTTISLIYQRRLKLPVNDVNVQKLKTIEDNLNGIFSIVAKGALGINRSNIIMKDDVDKNQYNNIFISVERLIGAQPKINTNIIQSNASPASTPMSVASSIDSRRSTPVPPTFTSQSGTPMISMSPLSIPNHPSQNSARSQDGQYGGSQDFAKKYIKYKKKYMALKSQK
jgi:serine/threonine protein kinase